VLIKILFKESFSASSAAANGTQTTVNFEIERNVVKCCQSTLQLSAKLLNCKLRPQTYRTSRIRTTVLDIPAVRCSGPSQRIGPLGTFPAVGPIERKLVSSVVMNMNHECRKYLSRLSIVVKNLRRE
jgi:hypothetical protein